MVIDLLVLRLWNYLSGYVIIQIEGLALEEFINICINRNIYLWDIYKKNNTLIEAKVSIKDHRKIIKVAKITGSNIDVIKKIGYPFWFNKIKKRKMLIFGAFFSLILLITMFSFIFDIEVIGNETIPSEKIVKILNDSGLSIGSNRYFINLREIENNLLLNIQELSWVGIEISGVKLKVNVVEKTPAPLKIHKDIPSNIVAKKYGIIEKVIVKNGKAMVSEGDIVSPGDILISGHMEIEDLGISQYLHAYGEVYAKTYYESEKTVDLIKTIKEKTGEKVTRKIIKLGKIEIMLNKTNNPYSTYVIQRESKKPFKCRNIELPVEIITEEIYETIEIKKRADIEKEKEVLHRILIEELLDKIPRNLEILNSYTNFIIKNDKLKCNIIIEVIEDIGEEKIQ
mgnify:FL=1